MITAYDLKTEYLNNPLGIDINHPIIYWKAAQAKRQTASEVRVSVNGKNYISVGIVTGSKTNRVLEIPLQSRDHVIWQVRLKDEHGEFGDWSESAFFEMGLLNPSDWMAKWIMGDFDHRLKPKIRYPVDCFRKHFKQKSTVIKARLYIMACGFYEAKLNGEKIGDQVLTPGSTAFQKRVHYQTYDVTHLIQTENEFCIDLADGFYAGKTGVFGKSKTFGHEPKVLAQLEITTSTEVCVIQTDASFDWSNDGPVLMSDLKDGEIVDSTRKPSYCGKAQSTSYEGTICCSNNVPVREMEQFDQPEVIRCTDGNIVLDFGQNIAGYMQMNVHGPKGHRCTMVFGEALDSHGNFSYKHISWEGEYDQCHFQKIDFTCDGSAQTYKPQFTVMGFQFVLLLNWPEEIRPENFKSIAVYSAMDTTFSFDSSNPDLNRIVQNTFWSIKGNFLDVPTDCPTRERAPWLGDAQLFFNTGSYMMDQRSFFRKWIRDIVDCQKDNGMVYNILPSNQKKSALIEWLSVEGSAGWGDGLISIPYHYWKRYGDDVLIREFWGPIKQCFQFYKRRMGKRNLFSLIRPKHSRLDRYICSSGRDFGEWAEPKDCSPPKLKMILPMVEEATAYLSYSAKIMAEMAEHLGERDKTDEYRAISEGTRQAYNYYFIGDGTFESSRMCKYARPCGLGLVDEKVRGNLLDQIVKLNQKRGYQIGTGFLSTPFILGLLTEAGVSDDAYKTLTNPNFGWMQQVNRGATTIWENWEPNASLNHYSKGACCQWLFDCLCGIRLDGRENHFIIKPHTVSQLDHVNFEYDSAYGKVTSGWKATPRGYQFKISVPANCTANVHIPGQTDRFVEAGEYIFND